MRYAWRICCAMRAMPSRLAISPFSAAFKRLLLRAIAIGRRRDTLKDTTLKQYHADLDRRLDRIMAAVLIPGSSPGTEPGKLRKRIAANRSIRSSSSPTAACHTQTMCPNAASVPA
jgi:hypothetical protein